MNDRNEFIAWVNQAEEDYILARSALNRKKPLTSGAYFHAQQCSEKYMKAVLIAKGQPFPKVHDLILINELCQKAGVFIGIDAKMLNTLASYAVRVRYPGEVPAVEEAKEALKIATTIRRFIRKYFNL